uniref:Putative dipeptidyl peptidase/kininase n=1 Tax=Ixodes ricinus TaxID=34613 RepID=A0A0K8R9M6_IXORI
MATSWFRTACGLLLLVGLVVVVVGAQEKPLEGPLEDEERAKAYLKDADVLLTDMCLKSYNAEWDYANNLTEHNKNKSVEQTLRANVLEKEVWKNVTQFKWTGFKDEETRTIFRRLSVLGTAILPEDKQTELVKIISDMDSNHEGGKICPFVRKTNTSDECNVPLEPTIKNTLQDSRNYEELLYVWNEWRKVAGKPVKAKYFRYVELENEDCSAQWFQGRQRHVAKRIRVRRF